MSLEKDELNAMSVDELWTLHEEVSAALLIRIVEQKRELEKRLAKLNQSGFPVGEFPDVHASKGVKTKRKYPKVNPKFRDPASSQTWSGRGKLPRWLTVAMQSGHSMEEYRIDESRMEKIGRLAVAGASGARR